MKNKIDHPVLITNDIVMLLNEISKVPEDNLLDKIITYCEINDFDPKEVGDVLEESEQFKTMLRIELEKVNMLPYDGPDLEEVDVW